MVWSWGLGAVSTAILVRWLTDPGSRDFDLSDLIALHASTCNELTETGRLCARHVLALLLPCSDWWNGPTIRGLGHRVLDRGGDSAWALPKCSCG